MTPATTSLKQDLSPVRASRLLNWRMLSLGFFLGILFCWLAVKDLRWQEVATLLKVFPWYLGVIAILLQFLAGVMRAFRWRLFFVEDRVTLGRLFLVQHVGLGLNNMFPIRVMGEPIQLWLLTIRGNLRSGSILATMLLDRTIDGMVSAGILWLGILFLPPLHGLRYFASTLFIVFAGLLVLWFIAPQVFRRIPYFQKFPFFIAYASAISAVLGNKWRLLLVLILSLGFWATTAEGIWLLAIGLGMDLSWTEIVFVVTAVTIFVSYVPSLPGATGTFEFVAIYLLGIFAVEKGLGFSFALLSHLVLFLPAIIITAFQLPREGMSFRQAVSLVRSWRITPGPESREG